MKNSRVLVLSFGLLAVGTSALGGIEDGLIAHYRFDGDAIDASGSGNDGTEVGGVSYTNGVMGQAASFDGSDDYVDCGNAPNLSPTNGLTISAWVKVHSFPTDVDCNNIYSQFVSKGPDTENGSYVLASGNFNGCLPPNDQRARLAIRVSDESGDIAFVQGTTSLNAGTWYHIAGTADGNRMRIFVNGVLEQEIFHSIPFAMNTDNLLLGLHPRAGFEYRLDGLLDELRIYDRVLSPEEIAELADVPAVPAASHIGLLVLFVGISLALGIHVNTFRCKVLRWTSSP